MALLVLCIMSYGVLRTAQVLEYRSARVFLEELKTIQPGQSEASVMPFILRYQGIHPEGQDGSNNDSYVFRIDPWHLMHGLPGPNWVDNAYRVASSGLGSWRRALRLHSWTVSGWVRFTDGKVKSVSGDVILEGENEWLLAEWHYGSMIPAYLLSRSASNSLPSEEPHYEAHWTHLHFGGETGEGIVSSVTPLSTLEELNAARSINLRCFMGGRGCHSLCDLMPDATRYRREYYAGSWGWNSGSWGIQPHDCK